MSEAAAPIEDDTTLLLANYFQSHRRTDGTLSWRRTVIEMVVSNREFREFPDADLTADAADALFHREFDTNVTMRTFVQTIRTLRTWMNTYHANEEAKGAVLEDSIFRLKNPMNGRRKFNPSEVGTIISWNTLGDDGDGSGLDEADEPFGGKVDFGPKDALECWME